MGYTVRRWIDHTKKKSCIASRMCRENGRLKATRSNEDDTLFEYDRCSSASFQARTLRQPKPTYGRNAKASVRSKGSDGNEFVLIKGPAKDEVLMKEGTEDTLQARGCNVGDE